jgi:hypothetical protein
MENIPRQRTLIKPSAIYPFFDKIQFWVCEPVDRKTLTQLRKQCGSGGIFAKNGPARFDAQFHQRVELRQPTDQALQWLTRRDDALINRAEITLDLVFKYRGDRDETWNFLHRYLVRRWHGKKQEIRVVRSGESRPSVSDKYDTRYDAGRSAPNCIAFYKQGHSRVTGEVNCLHLEWRLKGLKAVRSIGIERGRDLLEFDHRQFWQERLLLVAANKERLGRLIRNQLNGKKSRISRIEQVGKNFRINLDKRTGDVHVRASDTMQELIDELGPSYRINRAMVPIPNDGLLPNYDLDLSVSG